MKPSVTLAVAATVMSVSGLAALDPAVGTVEATLTCEGQLLHHGSPVNGYFDMEFRLYADHGNGAQVGRTEALFDVEVVDGSFSVELDFGASLDSGQAPGLEIRVRHAGRGAFMTVAAARAGLDLGPEEIVQSGGVDITVLGYSVPSCADWNNDTLPDLVVGEGSANFPGKVRVYTNVGTAGEPAFAGYVYAQSLGADLTVPGAGCLGAFPRVVHWDGDGRKDLLVGLADGRVELFLNTGTDASPTFGGGSFVQVGQPAFKVDIDVGSRATPAVVDWNNDDRKDLVVGAYDGYVRVYLNEGTDVAPDFRTEAFAEDNGSPLQVTTLRSSPAVADLTGDGKKDLLVGDTNGWLLLYENTATDEAPAFQGFVSVTSEGIPIDLDSTRSRPALCDWNSRGARDVLVGSSDGMVRLFRDVDVILRDGFETGDTSSWSAVVS